jgi:flagellin-like hook-associated protein FlgL
MVSRISNPIIVNTALRNIQTSLRQLQQTQEILSTGLIIRRPSDDPLGAATAMKLRAEITELKRFVANMDHVDSFVSATEGALGSFNDLLLDLREITVTEANDTSNAVSRRAAAEQVDAVIEQLLQTANADYGGRYLFAGHDTKTVPFSRTDTGAAYHGDDGLIYSEIGPANVLPVNIPGNTAFSTHFGQVIGDLDLNPDISADSAYDTPLALLNGGNGVQPGSIVITDGTGASATIDLGGAATIGDVINAINSAAGINVTAAVNADGNGLIIDDNTLEPASPLTITEGPSATTTAADLGILGSSTGLLIGGNVNPIAETATPLALLNGGSGVSLGSIRITNGLTTASVDLSGALTLDDIIVAINGAGADVEASLDSSGTRLVVSSLLGDTPIIIVSEDGGTTAEELGLFAPGLFETAEAVRQALLNNDAERLSELIGNVDDVITQIISDRAAAGQKLVQTDFARDRLNELELSFQDLRSKTEEADLTEFATKLVNQETIYQAALATTVQVIQPNLFNFLR